MENENEQTVRPKRMKTPKNMGEKQQTKQTKTVENQPLGAQENQNVAPVQVEKPQHSKKKVKITFLGGVGEIGKNMTAIEYGDEMIVVDAGLTFPGDDLPGVDLVVPDISYLVANKSKIKAIVLTHGHEDHIGGLPYVLNEINAPLYG